MSQSFYIEFRDSVYTFAMPRPPGELMPRGKMTCGE